MFLYSSDGAFRLHAARKGSKMAETRPATALGVNVVRYTLTADEHSAYVAASDDAARAKVLASIGRRTEIGTGKVQITKDALAAFTAAFLEASGGDATLAREAAAASLAAGILILPESASDDTASVLVALFPTE